MLNYTVLRNSDPFPKDKLAKRAFLLKAVEDIKDTIRASGEKSEELSTLAPEAVKALRESGLFRLKLPAVLGGAEADPVTEMVVLEELAYHDFTSGWCTMVGGTSVASLGAFLPQLIKSLKRGVYQLGQFPFSRQASQKKPKAGLTSRVDGVLTVGLAMRNGLLVLLLSMARKIKRGRPKLSFAQYPKMTSLCIKIGMMSLA